jgi:hypothetical protein
MAEQTFKDYKDELDALVKQFQALPDVAAKTDFLHENPKLQAVISVIHFPKPTKPATTTT